MPSSSSGLRHVASWSGMEPWLSKNCFEKHNWRKQRRSAVVRNHFYCLQFLTRIFYFSDVLRQQNISERRKLGNNIVVKKIHNLFIKHIFCRFCFGNLVSKSNVLRLPITRRQHRRKPVILQVLSHDSRMECHVVS